MYETFDHTADLGLRIRADDVDTLLAEAGLALESTLVENLDTVRCVESIEVHLPADQIEYLLVDWLRALLTAFEERKLLFSRCEVHIGPDGLHGRAWGEPADPDRHHLDHEVKAITYHGLRVEQTPQGWLAEVIIDI